MKKYRKKQEVQPNSQHEFSALKESIINLESLEQVHSPPFGNLLGLDWIGMFHSKQRRMRKH